MTQHTKLLPILPLLVACGGNNPTYISDKLKPTTDLYVEAFTEQADGGCEALPLNTSGAAPFNIISVSNYYNEYTTYWNYTCDSVEWDNGRMVSEVGCWWQWSDGKLYMMSTTLVWNNDGSQANGIAKVNSQCPAGNCQPCNSEYDIAIKTK